MRIVRYISLGLLAFGLMMSAAKADQPRVFGTTRCAQSFACSTDSSQIRQIANDCAVQGLGISSIKTGIFDSASFDSDNCMNGVLPAPSNGPPLTPRCCMISSGDSCSLHCQLLLISK